MNKALILGILTLLSALPTLADTRIESQDERGETSRFTSNGQIARVDSAGDPGYVLIDLEQKTFSSVDPGSRQIMRMDLPRQAVASAGGSTPGFELKKIGAGPRVAGFTTTEYHLIAGGQLCDRVYTSRQVSEMPEIDALYQAMRSMQQQSRNMMGGMMAGFGRMMSPCQQARLEVNDNYVETGAPLRIVDASGRLRSNVTRIERNVQVPSNYYQSPTGYAVVSMQDQMNQARQQMQQNMPDMNQIMQQMQQMQRQQPGTGGGMPPELMQQIEQMQQMFQQPQ